MAAVAGVDDRDAAVPAGPQGRALLGVADGGDVRIAGHHPDGVGHALAFGGAGHVVAGEAQHLPAQVEHGCLKGEAGAGGRLVKEGGQPLAGCGVPVGGGVLPDAAGQVQQGVGLLPGQVKGVDQMAHEMPPSMG